jgi:aminopeptidase 2
MFCDAPYINFPPPQALCSPLVEKLGLEYSKTDSADVTQLRTLAVGGAADIGDPA